MNYELLQVPRERCELRCAIAAQGRDRVLDTPDRARARVLETCDLLVDPRDDTVARQLLANGLWRWATTRTIADCMRPGTVCVDLGAGAGYFCALFQSLGAAAVVAVEACPHLARNLRATARLNRWQHVEVIECAIGDHSGTTPRLLAGGAGHPPQHADLPLTTLDELLGDLRAIQVLRLACADGDAERGPAVWRGMQNVLRNNPHAHVFVELAVDRDDVAWLRDVRRAGFVLRRCAADGTPPELPADLRNRGACTVYLHREAS